MKITAILITALVLASLATTTSAKRPPVNDGEIYTVNISGSISGSGTSNPTSLKGNVSNLVFNKADSASYDLSYFAGTPDLAGGSNCFNNTYFYEGTMQLYDGFQDGTVMARFWFRASDSSGNGDISYVLDLIDGDGPGWSGDFPPTDGGTISRNAESWELRTTKKRAKNACSGVGDFPDPDPAVFDLTHQQ